MYQPPSPPPQSQKRTETPPRPKQQQQPQQLPPPSSPLQQLKSQQQESFRPPPAHSSPPPPHVSDPRVSPRSIKKTEQVVVVPQREETPLAVLEFKHVGDNGGYIYWLGTAGKSRPFQNPHEEGLIKVISSGMAPGNQCLYIDYHCMMMPT